MKFKTQPRNPPTAVDLILEVYGGKNGHLAGLAFIRRKNPPYKGWWALCGGFQEYGESLEKTARREGREETNRGDIQLLGQLSVRSDPRRDPRAHVNSVCYVARTYGMPKAGDDAAAVAVFSLDELPKRLAFDHRERLEEYDAWKKSKLALPWD